MIHVSLHQSFQVRVLIICWFDVIKLVLSWHGANLLSYKLLVQVFLVDLSGSTLINERGRFTDDLIELKILQVFHVKEEIDSCVMPDELIAELHWDLALLVSSFVLADFILDRLSHIRLVLRVWDFESLIIVRAYAILIAPEHSDKWAVAPLFSLVLPALVID